jgi:phage shock protein A
VTGQFSPTGKQTTTENQRAIPKTSAGDAISELNIMREKLAEMMDRMDRLNNVDIGKREGPASKKKRNVILL